MTINTEDLINSIMESFNRIDYIKAEDIPNIELYMDQITTFMDTKLKNSSRTPGVDKILTKTMINNYAKNNLLPPPIRKKYSKEHIMLLIFIYYYKGILSMNDIQSLLTPLTERFFGNDSEFDLETIYEQVFAMEKTQVDDLKKEVVETYRRAKNLFPQAPDESQEFLQMFSFVCLLSFDVYVKKLLIEKIIDEYFNKTDKAKEKSKDSTKETI